MYQEVSSSCLLNNTTHILSVKQYKACSHANAPKPILIRCDHSRCKKKRGKNKLATFFNNQWLLHVYFKESFH